MLVISLLSLTKLEMDAQVVEMLTKGIQSRKRKEKAPDESSKRVKVGAPSLATPATTVFASKIAEGVEVIPTIEVGTTEGGSTPPTMSSPLVENQASHPPIEKDKGGEKKVIVKVLRKAYPSGSNDDSDNPREDPISDLDLIQDLTDKFVMPEVVD
ncbi:hypothetical protein COCNU_scaffold001699G000010 [Cocos nucifera]|nr:hypothetical protein [Cocos nucifera]